ncbi:MAG: toll/interleukin-1 receptor domain-containing protein, partial [Verrucomicrobia bacterium]|nr:toll/interleukin-1 receptor domain-containing protein [Verrucomicrobiota bacterium]
CRVCGQKLAIDSAAAGWEIRCPKCGTSQTTPVIAPEQGATSKPSPSTAEPQPAIPEFASRAPGGGEEFEYEAFISYRHVEPDRTLAQWLHTTLETYHVPKQLVQERGLPPRLKKLFRDEEELPASADLNREIERALTKSRFLIVICSPRTPPSQWVNAEVAFFRKLGRHDQILALLIEGEPSESFPQALREIRRTITGPEGIINQTIEEVEPLAADVRPGRKEGQRQVRQMAKLRILASILGIPFDDLRQRDRVRERARKWRMGVLLTAVALCFGIFTAAYLHQRQLLITAAKLRGADVSLISRIRTEQDVLTNRPPTPFADIQPEWAAKADTSAPQKIMEQRTAVTEGLQTYTVAQVFETLFLGENREARLYPPILRSQGLPPGNNFRASNTLNRARQTQGSGISPRQNPKTPLPPESLTPQESRLRQAATAPTEFFPEKFLLQGTLAEVRQMNNRAYIYLQNQESELLSAKAKGNNNTFNGTGRRVSRAACVVFDGRNVVQNMADYLVGQQVCIAVQRVNWTDDTKPHTTRPNIGLWSPAPWTINQQSPYLKEFYQFGMNSGLIWCCRGEGIEKLEQPSTWIDPILGRSERIGNEAAMQRSLRLINRDPAKFFGVRGLLEGTYAGLLPLQTIYGSPLNEGGQQTPTAIKDSDHVLIRLMCGSGKQRVAFGGESLVILAKIDTATAREFRDYENGVKIQADATIGTTVSLSEEQLWPERRPPQSQFQIPKFNTQPQTRDTKSDPRQTLSDPLAGTIIVNLAWIQIKDKPGTMVFADGPRRQGVGGQIDNHQTIGTTNQNTIPQPPVTKSKVSAP